MSQDYLTGPFLVRPLLEEERVAGEVGRLEDVDLGIGAN